MGMNRSKLGVFAAKSGILTGLMLSYVFFTDIRKLEYNILDRKQPVQEYYYPNPPVLSVDWSSNDQGMIETYIFNSETGRKMPLMYDLLPDNETLTELVNQRIEDGYLSKEELFEQLQPMSGSTDIDPVAVSMLEEMIDHYQGGEPYGTGRKIEK